ncbi:MAG: hypothetical protein QF535_02225, partial [Anaerolineales bacterium]|nr:hypothetical protein [Anaerolineales bacterium]
NTIIFYKNNASQGSLSFTTGHDMTPMIRMGASGNIVVMNFGSDSSFAGEKTAQGNQDGNGIGDFYYEPPTDYLALCSENLPSPSIALPGENFNTVLWTGDGASSRALTGVGFQPDLLWVKQRAQAISSQLYDAVRGTGSSKALSSDSTNAEGGGNADEYGYLSSFDSDGFTGVDGTSSPNYYFNESAKTFVAWNWKAGGTPTVDNSAGAGNTPTAGSVKIDGANLGSALAGSIAATRLSANTDAGFSIVSYTGTGSNATVGHGLSEAPTFIMIKCRSSVANWKGGTTLVSGKTFADGNGYYFELDDTKALTNPGSASQWGSTPANPTASVFSVGPSSIGQNADTETYVAYCFHSVEGYSKVGKYSGNGVVDGSYIYTGFQPAYLLIKRIDTTGRWSIWDNKRED